jgi:hypothetical protein
MMKCCETSLLRGVNLLRAVHCVGARTDVQDMRRAVVSVSSYCIKYLILDAFVKLRKATVNFVISTRPISQSLHMELGSH